MFSWFKPKDPLINLNKQYRQKLEQAMHSQRNGDNSHLLSLNR